MSQGSPWVDSTAGVQEQPQRGTSVARLRRARSTEPSGSTDWRGWLPSSPPNAAPVRREGGSRVEPAPGATGPVAPQPYVAVPEKPLPVRRVTSAAALWVVGAHGGSGESSVAGLSAGWAAADHVWPELPGGVAAPCVVVARTNVRGLLAARSALTQWAASGSGSSARLVGLVLVADAPGKLPAGLRDLAKVVGGGAPRVWEVPWLDGWRLGDPVVEGIPRSVSKLVSDLRSLAASATVGAATLHQKEQP